MSQSILPKNQIWESRIKSSTFGIISNCSFIKVVSEKADEYKKKNVNKKQMWHYWAFLRAVLENADLFDNPVQQETLV